MLWSRGWKKPICSDITGLCYIYYIVSLALNLTSAYFLLKCQHWGSIFMVAMVINPSVSWHFVLDLWRPIMLSIVCMHLKHDEDVIKWKHFPRNWPFVRGIHWSHWIPHTKASDVELWCFSLICVWINSWVNNCEAGDLRRHRGHYDVNVMKSSFHGNKDINDGCFTEFWNFCFW